MLKIKDKDSFLNGAGVVLQDLMDFADVSRMEIWHTIDPYQALSDKFRQDIVARIVALLTANIRMIEDSPQENGIEFEAQ